LVTDGYLRAIPTDPMNNYSADWRTVMEDATQSVSQDEPGIWDVHSGSDKTSLEGTPYSGW
jgi:general secretion pathway protein G